MTDQEYLRFDEAGSGPAVLLIHGFPLCRRMWKWQMTELANKGYRVIAPDLRGFGQSPPHYAQMRMGDYADDVVTLLDRLGIEQAVVVGMSMGGYVLLDLLERHRPRLAGAVFAVSRAGADDPAGREKRTLMIKAVENGTPGVVAESFETVLFAPDTPRKDPQLVDEIGRWMRTTSPQGLVAGLLAMRERLDYRRKLPEFEVPALVIGAQEDSTIPVDESRYLDEKLPDSTLCLVPGGGHMVNMEQPERFNACLLSFLDRLAGKGW